MRGPEFQKLQSFELEQVVRKAQLRVQGKPGRHRKGKEFFRDRAGHRGGEREHTTSKLLAAGFDNFHITVVSGKDFFQRG